MPTSDAELLQRVEERIANGEGTSLPGQWIPGRPVKISVGFRGEKGLPSKDDKITLRRVNRNSGNWETDMDLDGALRKFLGDEKPTRVPVELPFNDCDKNLFRELAAFKGGGHRLCHCGRFVLKGTDQFMTEGLPPLALNEFGEAGREYYAGIARRQRLDETGSLLKQEKLLCNWAECPYAQDCSYHDYMKLYGRKPTQKMAETIKDHALIVCKPHIVLTVRIANEAVGGYVLAFASTTSWASGMELYHWMLGVKNASGGQLAGIPLWLKFDWRQTRLLSGKSYWNPCWSLEVRGIDWNDLPKLGATMAGQQLQSAETAAQLAGRMQALPEGRALVREFHPELDGQDSTPQTWEEKLDYLLSSVMDWPENQVQDAIKHCEEHGDWEAKYEEYLAAWQAEHPAEEEEEDEDEEGAVIDADFEEPEEQPAGQRLDMTPDFDLPAPEDLSVVPGSRGIADAIKDLGWSREDRIAALALIDRESIPRPGTDGDNPDLCWRIMQAISHHAKQASLEDPFAEVVYAQVEAAAGQASINFEE